MFLWEDILSILLCFWLCHLDIRIHIGPLHVLWQASFGCWVTWSISSWQEYYKSVSFPKLSDGYTANVYRELQGLCGEIWVRGFQIYGDCMYTRNPCNYEISTLWFPLHCNICRALGFTGILWGFPSLNVGKPCDNLIFGDIHAKFAGISCKF